MKGFKTVVFFGATAVLGIVTAFQADDIKGILLPMICHVDPNATFTATDCTEKVVALTGKIVSVLGFIGMALRYVTTSAIFKPDEN